MTPTPPVTLSAIYIYPVKSCGGIALDSAQLDAWGLQFDRNWMAVDATGRFLSQREVPQLALVQPELVVSDDQLVTLRLTSPHLPGQPLDLSLSQPESNQLQLIDVQIWRDHCRAVDQGEAAAEWFSQVVGKPARLVKIGAGYDRPVAPPVIGQTSQSGQSETNNPLEPNAPDNIPDNTSRDAPANAQVSFADGYPLLLISEASLADLNQRLSAPIPMNRFRPNLVVTGCAAYAEDSWQQIRIGAVTFKLVTPCERCIITTTDQATGTRTGPEPLKTLATYRRNAGGVIFGQNLVHQVNGELRAGTVVEVMS